ncbi:uncharacterized protein LOC143828644 [Paroedura picta]|uniref:uncharacterized protein LOC143828644 n=1 Tax=Paroedura picta TaxID=143630 RepID=UPI004057083D
MESKRGADDEGQWISFHTFSKAELYLAWVRPEAWRRQPRGLRVAQTRHVNKGRNLPSESQNANPKSRYQIVQTDGIKPEGRSKRRVPKHRPKFKTGEYIPDTDCKVLAHLDVKI